MKKILLAGGAGYIGTMLARELIRRDYDVTIVDLLWFGNNLGEDSSKVKVIKKNIMELEKKDLEGFSSVVFLAGLSNDPMAEFSPATNFVENSATPIYLAYIAKMAQVNRYVYASSCSVYGYTANKLMDEGAVLAPRYPYGISKLIAEDAIMKLADEKFRPICLRKGTVGGFSRRMRYDLVVNAMTKTALTEKKIVVNNPSLWRPLVDIRDIVSAYVRSIESNQEVSGVYNISYDNYTIGRLADEIKAELKESGFDIKIQIKDIKDMRNYKVDNSKAKIELDFVPKISPRKSVRSILENIDLNDYDFTNKKYYNIQVFKELVI